MNPGGGNAANPGNAGAPPGLGAPSQPGQQPNLPAAAAAAVAAVKELSEGEALAAVQAGRAVSLESILPDVRRRTGGEIINAQLQFVQGFLVYAVKVLAPGGQVTTEYYYARTGRHVEP